MEETCDELMFLFVRVFILFSFFFFFLRVFFSLLFDRFLLYLVLKEDEKVKKR